MGGGFRSISTFHIFFFTFNVKNMSKNWEKNDKTIVRKKNIVHIWGGGGQGGGFRVNWTKSIKMFFFNFPNSVFFLWLENILRTCLITIMDEGLYISICIVSSSFIQKKI